MNMRTNTRLALLALAATVSGTALAADITMTPPPGGNVVINAAPATPAVVVQPSQQVKLPGLPSAPVYTGGVCHDATGTLGRCDPAAPGGSGPNVVTSDWFGTLRQGIEVTIDGSLVRHLEFNIPTFTAEALAQNDIQVFINFGIFFGPLPYTSYAGGKVSTISFRVEVGKLIITRFTHDNTASVTLGGNSALIFRYVMTPRVTLGPSPQ